MGDKVSIPRSYAGELGVADVQNSLRRRYIALPLLNGQAPTTGFIWGGNGTTGISPFERNVIIERMHAVAYCSTSFGGGSTLCVLSLFRNSSTMVSLPVYAGTTGSAMYAANDTTARLATVCDFNDNMRLYLANTVNRVLRLSVVLTLREALDS